MQILSQRRIVAGVLCIDKTGQVIIKKGEECEKKTDQSEVTQVAAHEHNMVTKEEIEKKIKAAFWDYEIDAYQVYLIALGQETGTRFLSREKILVRLLERLSWYELIDLFGREFLSKHTTRAITDKISNPELRSRYEFIGKVLQGKALSAAGWSDQNRKRLGTAVLSNRWYGVK